MWSTPVSAIFTGFCYLIIVQYVYSVITYSCAKDKCNGSTSERYTFLENNCRCDPDCNIYGDCCFDSPYNVRNKQQNFDCVDLVRSKRMLSGAYIRRTCDNPIYKKNCSSSKTYEEQIQNFELKIPVTAKTGITYGNKYCALCYNVTYYEYWQVFLECGSEMIRMDFDDFKKSNDFVFNNSTGSWISKNNEKTTNCTMFPSPDYRWIVNESRACRPNLISTCDRKYIPFGFVLCRNYTSIVRDIYNNSYKNEDCALCNRVPKANLRCKRNNDSSSTTPRSTFYTSTDLTSTSAIIKPDTNITNYTTKIRKFLHIRASSFHCLDILDYFKLTKIEIETKQFTSLNRTRITKLAVLNGYPIQMCQSSEIPNYIEKNEISTILQFFVNTVILISTISILLHLYDFFFTTFLSNLTQKIIIGYAIAFLIGNSAFIGGNVFSNYCNFFGFLTYYGFIASFFWITILSFDVSTKIWSCLPELEGLKRYINDNRKFKTYSLISWFVPILAIVVLKFAEAGNELLFYEDTYAYETCWFKKSSTSLLFFSFPLVATMSTNMALYLCSAYVVSLQPDAVAKLVAKYEIDFKIHTAFILATNLMWVSILLAGYFETFYYWILFAFADFLLGLSVYISSPTKHFLSIRISDIIDRYWLDKWTSNFNKQR